MLWTSYSDLRVLREKAPFAEVAGEIVKLDCGNHGNYYVQFFVGETKRVRAASGTPGKSSCGSVWIGKKASVWYSVADPNYIALEEPERSASWIKDEMGGMLFLGYPWIAGALLVIRVFQNRESKRGRNAA